MRKYNVLNPALEKAVVLKILTLNPRHGTELPRIGKDEAAVSHSEQSRKALALAEGTDMHPILLLGLGAGLSR